MITISTNKLIRVILIAAIILLAVNISPGQAEKLSLSPLTPDVALPDMGTAFTYQGRLMDGANPANGTYYFKFQIYDAESGGFLWPSEVTTGGLTVTNGLFMVELDFGSEVFSKGFDRWLAISMI